MTLQQRPLRPREKLNRMIKHKLEKIDHITDPVKIERLNAKIVKLRAELALTTE